MKLALVYPPFSYKIFNENISTVDNEFGQFPYISYGYVSSEAKKAGWVVKLFDAQAESKNYAEMLSDILAFQPEVLSFAAHATQTFKDMLLWANKMKFDTGLPILVGGYEAKRMPLEIMHHSCFDYLCAGEAQDFLIPFLTTFEMGDDFKNVPNLYFRDQKKIEFTFSTSRTPFKDFDIIDRSIFDHSKYYSHVSQKKNFTIGMSSDGCPYSCSFCCMSKTGFNARSSDKVFLEMKDCFENYGIKEIDWFDPVMLQNKKRASELCRLLIAENMELIWSTRTRIDSLTVSKTNSEPDDYFIKLLAKSGCRRLFIGIESGSDEILNNIDKMQGIANIKKVLHSLETNGILSLGFFMIGNPGETVESVKKTVSFAKTLPLDYAQFSMTIMKPHTHLYKEWLEDGENVDYWKEYVKGNVSEKVLPTPWTILKRDEIESFTKKAYLSFYFRPKYMYKMLRKVESLAELWRYIKVASSLCLRPNTKNSYSIKAFHFFHYILDGLFHLYFNKNSKHKVFVYGRGISAVFKYAALMVNAK